MKQVKMAANACTVQYSGVVHGYFEDCYFMPIGTTPTPVPESKNLGLLGLLVFGE